MYIDINTGLKIEESKLDYYSILEVKNDIFYCALAPNFIVISNLKNRLEKYKQDIEQVELFDMEREDYEAKKQMCKAIVLELRALEKEVNSNGKRVF